MITNWSEVIAKMDGLRETEKELKEELEQIPAYRQLRMVQNEKAKMIRKHFRGNR